MNRRFDSPLFWGAYSPLSAFTGMGLVLMASARFAFALVAAGGLIWVYGLTALVFSGARPVLPVRGRMALLLFISAFLSGIFMFLVGLLNPLLILGTGFFLLLIPPCCLGSGFFENSETLSPADVCSRSLLEAVVMGSLILALALIREPLGMGTLSFPGGNRGILELIEVFPDSFVLVRFLSVSAGGLLLLGYGTALFRYFRERNGGVSRPSSGTEAE